MSSRYEITISILDKDYVDNLIIALVRQGYSVYYNDEDNAVCYTTNDDEVYQLNE